jgi:hypothetical protein
LVINSILPLEIAATKCNAIDNNYLDDMIAIILFLLDDHIFSSIIVKIYYLFEFLVDAALIMDNQSIGQVYSFSTTSVEKRNKKLG